LSRQPKLVYLSLGSNLGDREANLNRALAAIEAESFQVTARSSIYETAPQDFTDQPWFLNLVVAGETACFPLQLLAVFQRIERELGRVRAAGSVPKGPRIIDIDILLYGNLVVTTSKLTLPHSRMLERRFVLEPLVEIAPDLRLPGTGRPVRESLRHITGQQLRRL
jgi:2-amino-4-hydroxy-6-hydroxymethyldihydropteridine diphosphokinase